MVGSTEDNIHTLNPEVEMGKLGLHGDLEIDKSSRTSISFITNDQDGVDSDAMDQDSDTEQDQDKDITLKEFIQLYHTGPKQFQKNVSNLLRELTDARADFSQARNELQTSRKDIGIIHGQFFESKRNYDSIAKELNDSKLESEQLKADIKQLRIEHNDKMNEINYKVEQLSRMLLQGQPIPTNSNAMMSTPSVQYYHPPPLPQQPQQPQQQQQQHHFLPSISQQHQKFSNDVANPVKTELMEQFPHPMIPRQQVPPSIHQYVPVRQSEYSTQPNTNQHSPVALTPGSENNASLASSPVLTTSHNSADLDNQSAFKYSLLKQITSIRQIWQEYAYGLNGQPSIKSLQIKYKTKWRYPEDASTFKRRKRIYKAIEIAMLNGLTEDELITELENHRLDKEGNYRRSLQWLCDNIPEKFKGA